MDIVIILTRASYRWNFGLNIKLAAVVGFHGLMAFQNLGGARTIGLKANVILLDKTGCVQAL